MNSNQERIGILVLGILLLLSTWGFPGELSRIESWVTITSIALLLTLYFFHCSDSKKTPAEVIASFCGALYSSTNPVRIYAIALISLASLLIISVLNPSHETSYLTGPDIAILSERDHIRWLPATAFVPETRINAISLVVLLGITGPSVFIVFKRRKTIRKVLWLITINALVLSVTGVIYKIAGSSKILGHFEPADARYFFSTFTYKNHWGAFCILALGGIGALTRYYKTSHRIRSLRSKSPIPVLVLASFLIGLTVPLSGSRSCTLIYALAYLVYTGQLVSDILPRAIGKTKKIIYSILCGLMLLSLLLFCSFLASEETHKEMLSVTVRQFGSLKEGQLETRFYIARDTFKMFLDKPIWGWGLGTYRFVINDSDRYLGNEHEYAFIHAHNDWLQYMSEVGIVGFLLIAILASTPYLLYKKRGMKNPITSWLWGTVFTIHAYALLEFPCRTPAVSTLAIVMVALATKYSIITRERANFQKQFYPAK